MMSGRSRITDVSRTRSLAKTANLRRSALAQERPPAGEYVKKEPGAAAAEDVPMGRCRRYRDRRFASFGDRIRERSDDADMVRLRRGRP